LEKDTYLDKLKAKYFSKKYFVWIFIIVPAAALIISTYQEQVCTITKRIIEPISYKVSPPSFETDNQNFKILILPFERTESEKLVKFESFLKKRFDELKVINGLNIEVIYDKNSDIPISFADAKRIGIERNADMVLFGMFYNEEKPQSYNSDINWVLTKRFDNHYGDSNSTTKEFSSFKDITEGKLTNEPEYVINWSVFLKYYSNSEQDLAKEKLNFLQSKFLSITNIDIAFNYYKGYLSYIEGNLDSAEIFSLKSLKLKYIIPETHNILGMIYNARNDKLKSASHFIISLLISPNSPILHNNLAVLFNRDYEMVNFSAYHFAKAIYYFPEYANAHYNYGNLFFYLKIYDSALVHYRTVIKIDSNYSKAYMNSGLSMMYLNNKDSTYYFLWKSIEVGPYNSQAYYNLGYMHEQFTKNIDSSIFYYRKSIQVNPKYEDAYINLGGVYYSIRHDALTAMNYYRQVISLNPMNFQAYWNIGLLHLDNNNIDSAKFYYKRAGEINPDLITKESDKIFKIK